MDLRFAQSPRKHRIERRRIRDAVEHALIVLVVDPPAEAAYRDRRYLFLGDDDSLRALEVMGVFLADGDPLVIHAMDLRDKYRGAYEEAKRNG